MCIRAFRALLGHFFKYPKVIYESISISFSLGLGHLGLFARVCVKGCAFNGDMAKNKKNI